MSKSEFYPRTKHDKKVLADAIKQQKAERLTKSKMVSAIQEMMQGFGIPVVEFADEDGTVHGRIKVPKPEDIPCDVPAYGGGTVSIRQGDHIRLWYKDYQTGWTIEGQASGRLSQGIVLCIRPDRQEGSWTLAYQRDNSDKNEGPSSCCIRASLGGFSRAVEKLP